MLTRDEKRMLYWASAFAYGAEGLILDQGAFLGGSTMCFAAALRRRGFARPLIHSYDLFRLGPFERETYFAEGEPPGGLTRPLYDANLGGFQDLICVHEGDILLEGWSGHEIEILFVDVAKTARIWDHLVGTFFPSLIPDRSLLVLQDYLFAGSGPWHHVVMEKLAGFFSPIGDTGINSALFEYHGGLSVADISAAAWDRIEPAEKVELMERVIDRADTDEKRAILAGPRAKLTPATPTAEGAPYGL